MAAETQLSFWGTQLPLLSVPTPPEPPGAVDPVPSGEGQRRRDAGIAAAGSHQSAAIKAAWSRYADGLLEGLCRQQRTVHTDDLSALVTWPPIHPNQWGGVWQRAVRRDWLERSGEYRATAQPGKHAHQYPVYRSLLAGQTAQESEAA